MTTLVKPLILFDLDGTLTDSRPGIVRSIQYALRSLGRRVPEEEELLWCIGPPLRDSFVRLLGTDSEADAAVGLYRERFSSTGLYENRVYDGVPELLEALKRLDISLHVATSKPHVFAQRIVRHFGMDEFFDSVFGAELDGERGGKTELLAWILETTGANAADVTMIGDRAHDMIGASTNGIQGIGVLYGYGSRAELMEGGARAVVETPAQLIAEITEIGRGGD